MLTGENPYEWKIITYWVPLIDYHRETHRVLTYAMEQIMMPLNFIDTQSVAEMFTE